MWSWSWPAYLPSLFLAARLGDAACLALVVDLCSIRAQVQYGDEELPRQAARGSAAAGERLADVTRTYNVDPTTIGRFQSLSIQDQACHRRTLACCSVLSRRRRSPFLPPRPD